MVQENKLSDFEFQRLSDFIYSNFGIKLPNTKKVMLEARLQSRLKATNFSNFNEYCKYVFSPVGMKEEIPYMIDVVSTNKTDFFREKEHFNFLQKKALPFFMEKDIRHINVWSSASSSGEEAYTLAMILEEWAEKNTGFSYHILGTDISSRVIEKAKVGIYNKERIDIVPANFKHKYFLKHKDPEVDEYRICKKLRDKVEFRRFNLVDDSYEGISSDFHLVFCRNVLIYFDKKTQEKVISKIMNYLKNDGFLFLGHSESISGLNLNLSQLQPTIYTLKHE